MTRAARSAVSAALAVACLGTAQQAQAAPLPTTLLSGLLTLNLAPVSASLTTSGSTVSGSLGTTTVIDGRLGATGYDVSVTTNGFDLLGPTPSLSATTHIPASSVTAAVTATTGGTASTSAYKALPASPLFHLTYPSSVLSVNLTSTYTLALSLTVPAAAATGRYTGTVTQTLA